MFVYIVAVATDSINTRHTKVKDNKPEADLINVVCLQQHLPQQTEEEWGRTLHGEVGNDVILIGHGLPLPVLLLHILLQVETRFLRNIVLLEERLSDR